MSGNPPEEAFPERLEKIEKQLEKLNCRIKSLEIASSADKSIASEQGSKVQVEDKKNIPTSTLDSSGKSSVANVDSKDIRSQTRPKAYSLASKPPKNKTDTAEIPNHIPPTSQVRLDSPSVGVKQINVSSVDFRETLSKIGLMPPKGDDNLEIQIGTWWTTRIGILLAVISGAFFAVYVAKNIPPYIRFLELLGGSIGLTILGLWLEKRYRRFGEILFGGGLAMLYFTAYAGYAIDPVKVMTNPTVAVLVQFAAALIMLACALFRRSIVIATVATFLGYVGCFFSFTEGLNNYALIASLVLAIMATCFYLFKQWSRPYLVSVPLTYFIYGVILVFHWFGKDDPVSFPLGLGYLMLCMTIFCGTDYIALIQGILMSHKSRRFIQICNSAAAIGLGFLLTILIYPNNQSMFYFIFGGYFVAASLLYYLTQHPDAIMHNYFIKGFALVTLGIMTEFDARTRWMALAVESLVLLFSVKRAKLIIVEAAMVLVWILSFLFFINHTIQLGYFKNPPGIITHAGILSLLYLTVSCLLFCLQGRWLGANVGVDNHSFFPKSSKEGQPLQFNMLSRNYLNVIYALVLGLAGYLVGKAYLVESIIPLGLSLIALFMVFTGLVFRHWIPLVAASLPFILSHLAIWNSLFTYVSLKLLWINASIVIPLTLIGAITSYVWGKAKNLNIDKNQLRFLDAAFHILWMVALQIVLYHSCSFEVFLLISVLVSLIIAAVTIKYPFYLLADFSALPILLALISLVMSTFGFSQELVNTHQDRYLWLAMLGAFGFACSYAAFEALHRHIRLLQKKMLYQKVHLTLAILVGYITLSTVFTGKIYMLSMAIAALMVALLTKWPGLKPALLGSIAYTLLAHAYFYSSINSHALSNNTTFLYYSLIVAAIAIIYAVICKYLTHHITLKNINLLQWLHGALALCLLYQLFYHQAGALQNYTTALWGASAVGTLVVGLVFRTKPLRVLGLVGLAICIPRVFMVDVRSTFYRIIAFGILSVVLLMVGFLYNRFHDFIQRYDEEVPDSTT